MSRIRFPRRKLLGSLVASLSKKQVAELYEAAGWSVRKCAVDDYEIQCSWAELVIDGDMPIVLHGPVGNIVANAKRILQPLREAGVVYTAECYGEDRTLLEQFTWSADDGDGWALAALGLAPAGYL